MRVCAECGKFYDRQKWDCPFCRHQTKIIQGHWALAPELANANEGFEPEYFCGLAELESRSFWFRSRNRLIIWALQRYFPSATNFLEIGCGTGFVLSGIKKALPELILSGSEVFSEGLTFAARRLPGVELFQMDARRIPFVDEFDVVGAFDVIEHIKEDEQVLCQMYQATRKGGGIIITVPQHPFLWSQADDFARHVRRYRTRELTDKITRAGFAVVRQTSFVTLLLPMLTISRVMTRRSRKPYDPNREFRMLTPLDVALEKILDAERALIRAGVSFPMGGSLLLVARKAPN